MAGVSAYDVGTANASFYPPATYDPPIPYNPYTPMNVATSAGKASGTPSIPLVGLLVLGAIIVLFHHFSIKARAGGVSGSAGVKL